MNPREADNEERLQALEREIRVIRASLDQQRVSSIQVGDLVKASPKSPAGGPPPGTVGVVRCIGGACIHPSHGTSLIGVQFAWSGGHRLHTTIAGGGWFCTPSELIVIPYVGSD